METNEYLKATRILKEKVQKEYELRLKKVFEICNKLSENPDNKGVSIYFNAPRIKILAFYDDITPSTELIDCGDYKIEIKNCTLDEYRGYLISEGSEDIKMLVELYDSCIYSSYNYYINYLKNEIENREIIKLVRK